MAVAIGVIAVVRLDAHGPLHEQIQSLDVQLAACPTNALLWVRRADLHRLDGGVSNALADLVAAARLQPDLESLAWVRGQLRLDVGELAAAAEDFTRLIERRPTHAGAWAARARAHEALGRLAEAVEDYSGALRWASMPEPDLYLARARVERRRGPGCLADALRGLEEGLMRLGPLGTLHAEAAEIEVALGRTDDAVRRLRLLAGRSARQEPWLVRVAEILGGSGRKAEAEEAWKDAYRACLALPPRLRQARATRDLEKRIAAALPPDVVAALVPPLAPGPAATSRPVPSPVSAPVRTTVPPIP